MKINYKDPHYAFTLGELIDKQIYLEEKDSRIARCNMSQVSIDATTSYFINSSKNWFPSVISLDKPFRQN